MKLNVKWIVSNKTIIIGKMIWILLNVHTCIPACRNDCEADLFSSILNSFDNVWKCIEIVKQALLNLNLIIDSASRPQGTLFLTKMYGPHAYTPRYGLRHTDGHSSDSSLSEDELWTDSPWPPRNAPCFDLLNSFMERSVFVVSLIDMGEMNMNDNVNM